MTRADPLSPAPCARPAPRSMIRSDYRLCRAAHARPSRLALASTSTFPFVGRSAELETLRTLMPRAEGEGRRVVLLGGEPGSGKSRLVREFAGEAAERRRARPLRRLRRGRAHPVRARSSRRSTTSRASPSPAELRAALGTGGRRADAAAPRSAGPGRRSAAAGRGRSGHRAPPPAHRRHRPAHAASAARRPVLLVIEDGHWADAPDAAAPAPPGARRRTRARAAARARSATPRPTCREALSETLADLRRSDDVVRLRLAGLSGDEVARVRAPRRGRRRRRRAPELAQAISDLTDGNPFLVCELWRALVETRRRRGRRRHDPAHPPADRARHPRERARGRQPAARPAGARDHRPARARRHRRRRVRARHRAPRRRPRRARAARGPRRGGRAAG